MSFDRGRRGGRGKDKRDGFGDDNFYDQGSGGGFGGGGFGDRGIEGKILAAHHARTNNVPYLGICLGLQIATIEFCRNVLGMKGANSTEFEEVHLN